MSDDPTTTEETPWTESLPDDLKDENLDRFTTPADLARSYINLEKRLSTSVQVPEHADADGLQELYRKLGGPEKADGYPIPEDAPADVRAKLEAARESAWKSGVTTKGWEAIVQQMATAADPEDPDLASEWENEARQKFSEEDLALAKRRVVGSAPQAEIDRLNKTGLGNSPWLIQLALDAEKANMEDTTMKGTPSDGATAIDEIKRKRAEIMAKPEFSDPSSPVAKHLWNEAAKLVQRQREIEGKE